MDDMHEEPSRLRSALVRTIEDGRLPGLQYLAVNERGVCFEFCGGKRDIAANLAVTPATIFMASSTTKLFTAAAILQLVELGKVELDSSLSNYFADHPYGTEVRIRHLLNQTSGIPNLMPLTWIHNACEHSEFSEDAALIEVLTKMDI
jgi:CubicO group peptidase (beta-lactamase class C family)